MSGGFGGNTKLLRRPDESSRSSALSTDNLQNTRTVKEREEDYNRARERILGSGGLDASSAAAQGGRGNGSGTSGRGASGRGAAGAGRESAGRGNGRRAVMRDRDREQQDPDYARGANRYASG